MIVGLIIAILQYTQIMCKTKKKWIKWDTHCIYTIGPMWTDW